MAVSLVQSAQYAGTSATTTMVFTLGSTPTVGNLLIFIAEWYDGDGPLVTPSGWTKQHDYQPIGVGVAIFYRIVQSGDGTSWTLTYDTTADQNSGFLLEVSGQASSSFFNQVVDAYSNATPTSLASGAATPSVLSCLAIAAFVNNGSSSTDTSTITTGWTKRQYANASFQPSWLFTRNALTSDTTTAISATISSMNGGGVNAIGTTILIAPSGGTTPTNHNLSMLGVGV
jgi:hypothetical protein